jgi:hypothetical protein
MTKTLFIQSHTDKKYLLSCSKYKMSLIRTKTTKFYTKFAIICRFSRKGLRANYRQLDSEPYAGMDPRILICTKYLLRAQTAAAFKLVHTYTGKNGHRHGGKLYQALVSTVQLIHMLIIWPSLCGPESVTGLG